MAPAGQSASWSDVLCCRICSELFSSKKLPINLACGHTICHNCLKALNTNSCPLDQTVISLPFEKLPPNLALLSVLSEFIDNEPRIYQELSEEYRHIESTLIELASYLHPVECLFGGSVWSDELSRSMQRKLISLLCYQLMEYKGLQRALKTARALAERALLELIIYHQDNSNISAVLWSAIRSRGCQFLGPAMQEEVLKLILLILSEGALMSRKTLVLYIVQTLREDYPQASKTCVGHVVQLLYRASCFNVLKREGESSLMQLKTQFRDYDALRREHDIQIVQVAFEQGLRISPDQWSALLYGDQHHRSHMQSIIDKLQSTQDFEQQISDLKAAIEQSSEREMLSPIFEHFERFANFDYLNELPDWTLAVNLFDSLLFIVKTYVKFMQTRNTDKFVSTTRCARPSICRQRDRNYKTRFSRDMAANRVVPTGLQCTYAFAKNRFHAPLPQVQSYPLPVLVEPMPAEYVLSPTAVSQLQMAELPPLLTNTSPIGPLSNVGNNGFTEAEESSVKLVRNLVPPTQPLPASSVPLVPFMAPAVNYAVPSPLLPVAALIQVAVPGSAGFPVGMTPIFQVPSSPLQISPTRFGYISERDRASGKYGNTQLLGNVITSNEKQIFQFFQTAGTKRSTFSDYLSDEVCPIQYKTPMEPSNSSHMQDSVHRIRCVQNGYAPRKNEIEGEQHTENTGANESVDEDDLKSHVSYTVAKSVLYEDKEMISTASIQLPSIPMHIASSTEQILNSAVKVPSVPEALPIIHPLLSQMSSTIPASVQSPCTIVNIKDTIKQPLRTSCIQQLQSPLTVEMDPFMMVKQLPPEIYPMPETPSDSESVISNTEDEIISAEERMNVVRRNDNIGHSVEKQQLKTDLNIANRQIQPLNKHTYLRELKAVDKKTGNLSSETTIL